jgi:hypothetical protein
MTSRPSGSASPCSNGASSALSAEIDRCVAAIEAQLSVQLGRPRRVLEACEQLAELVFESKATERRHRPAVFERLLAALLPRRGDAAAALLEQLEGWVWLFDDKLERIAALLGLRDKPLRRRLLALLAERAAEGRLRAAGALLERLGQLVEESPEDQALLSLAEGLLPEGEGPDTARQVMLKARGAARCLGARVLDHRGPLDPWIARELLGDTVAPFFEPYLEYTRATHRDLLDLLGSSPGELPPALVSLRAAEEVLGHRRLAELIGELGWRRLGCGLHVERTIAISVDGGYPLHVYPEEVCLLEGCGELQDLGERVVVIAHGVAAPTGDGGDDQRQTVARFRRYNVAHAEALAEIMEVAPLTPAKVRRIVDLLAGIVSDYLLLFAEQEEGAAELPGRWQALRSAAEAALESAEEGAPLDAETTRLVQMFEEPSGVSDVTTLHGLKRYLHQAGLRHAFSRFRVGQAANRTVDLALIAPRQPLRVVRRLRYLDFEPGEPRGPAGLPLPVATLARALARQLTASPRKLPHVEALVYGNEVQVYVSFRNHPAFLRVDFSPPLRGGMVDLEYYGVSQYELEQHPDLSLWAIQQLFSRVGFHVEEQRLRLHVRFDKEAAFDFAAILEQAEALFHLLPYLMDIDWVVGSLDYPQPARCAVVDAWADFWQRNGVLPVEQLLTADRRKIRLGSRQSAAGVEELFWDGRGRYRDAFSAASPQLWRRLRAQLEERGLDELARWDQLRGQGPGQLPLERAVLEPLRQARRRGEVVLDGDTLRRAGDERFVRENPALRLARRLAAANDGAGLDELRSAAVRALQLRVVERQLRWQPAGSINGHELVAATLALRGHRLGVFVLRDAEAISSLALVADEGVLYRTREGESWRESAEVSPEQLAAWLRRDNYLADVGLPAARDLDAGLAALLEALLLPTGRPPWRPHPSERLVPAAVASPGRAAGFARLGRDRGRGSLEGQVLVVGAITPDDAPALRAAAAIVSTGGGILSHAGLTALELGKPAVMIPGELEEHEGDPPRLRYQREVFAEDEHQVGPYAVRCRRALEQREEQIVDGDLLVVDADGATLEVLGRDSESLAIHGELVALQQDDEASNDPWLALSQRGTLLRAYHQLEKLLGRIERPALARYAVWEVLSGRRGGGEGVRRACGAALRALFDNPTVGPLAQRSVTERYRALVERRDALAQRAREGIAEARNVFEVALLLSRLQRAEQLAQDVGALLAELFAVSFRSPLEGFDFELARQRLIALRQEAEAELARGLGSSRGAHLHRTVAQLTTALEAGAQADTSDTSRPESPLAPSSVGAAELVVDAADAGLELRDQLGGKAAHLGELGRALDGQHVPPWFVVTDQALRLLLAEPVRGQGGGSLGDALRQQLDGEKDLARKASRCAALWRAVALPAELEDPLRCAYERIAPPGVDGKRPFVAVRSSAAEEDSEASAWAGAFDTFLFVRGWTQLCAQLRAAFASFWGERALALRRDDGLADPRGGGVVVQRMVDARAAGVVYSAAAVAADPRELVLNVGLGLGEGVVSGVVEVDQVTVLKRSADDAELRFAYRVGDKDQQVVFDAQRGEGTAVAPTLYHQRLRPALEYADLRELVDVALRLEHVLGQPLDIEFAFEGSALSILQVRPIPVFHAAYRELLKSGVLVARRSR